MFRGDGGDVDEYFVCVSGIAFWTKASEFQVFDGIEEKVLSVF